ncbi:hypothetical protein LCGC14_1275590 [marine sediment metagenome]|uniref:Uncharacterized protein n=1 Tax=marine sediment metagenome TaxID=412755 RepID=A0A0F9LI39_9ZZZZ
MDLREDIEIWWRLRRWRLFRIDREQAKMWATLLAVLIGFGLTLFGVHLVLARIDGLIRICLITVEGYNSSVTEERAVVIVVAAIGAASLVCYGLWRRRWARLYEDELTVKPSCPRSELWFLVGAAILMMVVAVVYCVSCLRYW